MLEKNIVKDIYENGNKYKNIDLDHHTKVALRELALEEVRKKEFPTFPSRIKSLYVSKNIEDAEMWLRVLLLKVEKYFQ